MAKKHKKARRLNRTGSVPLKIESLRCKKEWFYFWLTAFSAFTPAEESLLSPFLEVKYALSEFTTIVIAECQKQDSQDDLQAFHHEGSTAGLHSLAHGR